ncbi:MAG: hypothetical protein E6X17_15540 [Sporomusaceae bacterium]|nr:hypothetical protein [Sporomusaceae bacterium]
MAWVALLLSAVLLLVAFGFRRRPQRRLQQAASRLALLTGKDVSAAERYQLLKELFGLVARPQDADEKVAYQAVDLLQTAYGRGLARPDEPIHLTSLAGALLSGGNPGLAAAALDCYRGLLRTADAVMAAEQLQTAGVLALRAKQGFVAAKAVDILFALVERPARAADPAAVAAVLGAVRIIGKLSLGRGDRAFFRELTVRLRTFLFASPPPAAPDAAVAGLFSVWLRTIINNQDEAALPLLAACMQDLAAHRPSEAAFKSVLAEGIELAAAAGANPHNRTGPALLAVLTDLVRQAADIPLWRRLVMAAMQSARILLEQYDVRNVFTFLYPLLECSRLLVGEQIRFPGEGNDFRRQALLCVIREFLAVAEFSARLRLTDTAYQVLEAFYQCWRDDPALSYQQKSAKRLFQLFVLFWKKHMLRQPEWLPQQLELLEPPLLTAADLERLDLGL